MDKWVPALRLTGIGFFIITCILLGIGAGLWIDDKLKTDPWFFLVGLAAGLVMAAYGVYRMIRPFMNDNQHKEKG